MSSAAQTNAINAQRRYMMQRALLLSQQQRALNVDRNGNSNVERSGNGATTNENGTQRCDCEACIANASSASSVAAAAAPLPQPIAQTETVAPSSENANDVGAQSNQVASRDGYQPVQDEWQNTPKRYATRFATRQPLTAAERFEQEKQAAELWRYTRQQYAKLDALLASRGLARVPIASDGNCLFHSLAAYFDNKTTDHRLIRQKICDYIDANRDLFKVDIECEFPSVDAYLREMRIVGSWGNAVCVQAFCLAFDINVILFTPDGCMELYPSPTRMKIGLVAYQKHYSATRVLDGTELRMK